MTIQQALAELALGRDLRQQDIAAVFGVIMEGQASPAQIGGLLMALRCKGETAEEIAGAAQAMRARALRCACPEVDTAVDTCGTGGDGSGHVNISTIAAIVAAAAGARVAKHGNRAQSSKSGSADVLAALGVTIEAPVAVAERCLAELGIAFLFAPAFHAATRHAAAARKELGTRTIFNLLGPLTNPAGVRNQIVGVFAEVWCEPVAAALGQLGSRCAYVIHGHGGIDEIATRGPTRMALWEETRGAVTTLETTPADFGLADHDPAGLAGGDAAFNANVARAVLSGDGGAVRAAVLMETAVALTAAGIASDFRDGVERGAAAIDSGAASTTLARWVSLSGGAA